MDCEWTIQAPPSSNVQLIFLTFDLENSENCTYDYVQVFSGMEDTSGPMYGQYCGNIVSLLLLLTWVYILINITLFLYYRYLKISSL